ncbi:putative F-box family protein [Quillaja saponaria]|uniref:F-box family protein n=1 Tax=Quillaja saponaria TaxID=32244 RepID=A0AAD7LBE4_QUISA|nr:putative F-box family protein [Quillaja saponaria]
MVFWRRINGGSGQPSETAMPNLPQDIIVEILLKLPVKTLCRCRCVSKLWNSLISDSQFAKTHLYRGHKDYNFHFQRLKLLISSRNLWSIDYESSGNDIDEIASVELDYPLKDMPNGFAEAMGFAKDGLLYCRATDDAEPVVVRVDSLIDMHARNWVEILGSSNGLTCIIPDEDVLFLFNPSTRKYKRIPDPPVESHHNSNSLYTYGFGYDNINDDYKVIRTCNGALVNVYSLRTDSWRWTGIFPYQVAYVESGKLLNGALHWVVRLGEDIGSGFAVAVFDLTKEKFWDMPAPVVVDNNVDFVMGALNERLCILHNHNGMRNDFWMMDKYSVAETWTRITISMSYIYLKPLCITKADEALFEKDGTLVIYNIEDHTYRDLEIPGIPSVEGLEADMYIESLISPDAYCNTGACAL